MQRRAGGWRTTVRGPDGAMVRIERAMRLPLLDSGKEVVAENMKKRPRELAQVVDRVVYSAYPALFRVQRVSIFEKTPFYRMMTKAILEIRNLPENVGRDLVVQQSVYCRSFRHYLRRELGDGLIQIVLNTKKELLSQRIFDRDEAGAAKLGMPMKERLASFGGEYTSDMYKDCQRGCGQQNERV